MLLINKNLYEINIIVNLIKRNKTIYENLLK